ncbi:MAG: AAA family ATPase [Prevotellaceae bacterium]|nr:AAA family ATPase [Prevotellaceae bacterium]
MEDLRNLQQMGSLAGGKFNQYDGEDFILPQVFKDNVKEINNCSITYNKYSAIIETPGNQHGMLNIFMPNQWFFIASYFTDFYNELQKYKKYAMKVASKERLKNLNGGNLNRDESSNLMGLDISDTSKNYLERFMTDYTWWGGAKTIDRGDFYVSPILNYARLVNASQSFVADLCAFLADKHNLVNAIISEEDENPNKSNRMHYGLPLQQIYYGAPGTGKSHAINKLTEGENVIRTTFHPDSDYSTFVGAYKPTMGLLPICDELGQPMKIGSTVLHKEQIIYEFVDQAFLQAYVQAWKFYAENADEAKKQYLVIEEINRGNCAQIFGDLFQLLDRNDYGFSVYPINADKDMKKQLAKAFKGLNVEGADKINALYKGKDVVSQVLSGDILLLPDNLYIWATMNTSDQSLFPIDSAFKRRWEWQYMPIDKGYDENGNEIKWAIEGATKKYSWWSFLEKINAQIGEATQSEDKKLGFFFCKAINGVISAEKFVGKVIFYLWNDVFKNNGFEGPIFKDVDGTELSFSKFYKSDMKGNAIVQKDKVEVFLNNLGVEIARTNNPTDDLLPEVDEDGNNASSPTKDYSKYAINGSGSYSKGSVVLEAIIFYI